MLEMDEGELDAPCLGRALFHRHLPTEPHSLYREEEQQPGADTAVGEDGQLLLPALLRVIYTDSAFKPG